VRDAAREEDERAGRGAGGLVAALEGELALEHVERLVLLIVHVQRRRGAGRDERFDEAEGAAGRLHGGLEDHPVLEEPVRRSLARPEREHARGRGGRCVLRRLGGPAVVQHGGVS
jgi:hypothetical protein